MPQEPLASRQLLSCDDYSCSNQNEFKMNRKRTRRNSLMFKPDVGVEFKLIQEGPRDRAHRDGDSCIFALFEITFADLSFFQVRHSPSNVAAMVEKVHRINALYRAKQADENSNIRDLLHYSGEAWSMQAFHSPPNIREVTRALHEAYTALQLEGAFRDLSALETPQQEPKRPTAFIGRIRTRQWRRRRSPV